LPGCGLVLARIGDKWSAFVIALFGAAQSCQSRHNPICPTGTLREILSILAAKNISVFQKVESVVWFVHSAPAQGRTRRHERGAECGGRESR
jgi:hypothetical protein